MPDLSADQVRCDLSTRVFGQNIVYAKQIDSTNTALKQLARQGAPAGLLYLADEQTAGRGRLERRWLVPAGSSLLLSLLFRPEGSILPAQSQWLTMLCALALADAVDRQTGLSPRLKWPNDLIWTDGKKLAGILTEIELEDDRLAWVVVGLGLNVNVDFYQIDPSLAKTATSLSTILGRDTADLRLPLLQAFLVNVEQRYDALCQGQRPYEEWRSRLAGLGQPVIINGVDGRTRHGFFADVDENGALLLRQADGSTTAFWAGDVSLRLIKE